ncbi:hypothetical protein SAMN04515671_4271 [Nakamurella panacisegetis]|uniref:Uncharacterized protein n=1 Tax=Nakamurella panacisegetis TaxID=1090615 RepID=A0A1H0SSI6_9ACTN|nr:hypothetical protein [Nakamurella panacisegetis]SDP44737.1 hypothetical protein SAMN04515671_4271 [Nakamurella panacisegetis]
MRIPGPNDLLKLAGRGYGAIETAIGLVPRLVTIVGEVEMIMVRVAALMDEVETTNRRAAGVVIRTETVVSRVETVVGRADVLTDRITPLLDGYQPVLARLEPMLARLADTTSPVEVDAIVQLVDTLPDLAEKMRQDIVPILDTLGTVAPDLRDLLDVSKELNEMLGALPGLGRIKKKIEERQEFEDNYRADEEPPSSPDRPAPIGLTRPY